jgi:hypothetical protein
MRRKLGCEEATGVSDAFLGGLPSADVGGCQAGRYRVEALCGEFT